VRTRFLAFALAVLASASLGYARQSTLNMSCAQAAALVASQGAIVLTTGQHTYERFVAHPGFCMLGEYGKISYAPTADTPQCRIGYTCQYRPQFFDEF
jgi:hypothetical protein